MEDENETVIGDEAAMVALLKDLIVSGSELEDIPWVRFVRDFREAGLLTRDSGLVVRFNSGSEFQLTVVQVRQAD